MSQAPSTRLPLGTSLKSAYANTEWISWDRCKDAIVVGGKNGLIEIFNLNEGKKILSHRVDDKDQHVAMLPYINKFVTASPNGQLGIYNFRGSKESALKDAPYLVSGISINPSTVQLNKIAINAATEMSIYDDQLNERFRIPTAKHTTIKACGFTGSHVYMVTAQYKRDPDPEFTRDKEADGGLYTHTITKNLDLYDPKKGKLVQRHELSRSVSMSKDLPDWLPRLSAVANAERLTILDDTRIIGYDLTQPPSDTNIPIELAKTPFIPSQNYSAPKADYLSGVQSWELSANGINLLACSNHDAENYHVSEINLSTQEVTLLTSLSTKDFVQYDEKRGTWLHITKTGTITEHPLGPSHVRSRPRKQTATLELF